MNKISIVIPTIGRKNELDKLLKSILRQDYEDLEIIVVDQNKEIDLTQLIEQYKEKISITHYKVDFKGAAKARNYGAERANGDIINFPDDDCVFADGILKFVDNFFSVNDSDALFGKVKDLSDKKDILHFCEKDTKVKKGNIYQTTIETSMFIKREKFQQIGMYDENFGVGTYFGAEEGADLVSRLLYNKTNMIYVAKTFFYHPNKRDYTLLNRAYSYNLGFGALVYKHIKEYKRIYPMLFYWILKVLKNILGMLTGIITLNKQMLQYHYICFKGKIRGVIEKRKDY